MYTCDFAPLHIGAFINKFDYKWVKSLAKSKSHLESQSPESATRTTVTSTESAPSYSRVTFRLPYATYFGAISALTRQQVKLSNGYSNKFWGWGGEDDDLGKRWSMTKSFSCHFLLWNKMKAGQGKKLAHQCIFSLKAIFFWCVRVFNQEGTLFRYPHLIGRTYMIPHERDNNNQILGEHRWELALVIQKRVVIKWFWARTSFVESVWIMSDKKRLYFWGLVAYRRVAWFRHCFWSAQTKEWIGLQHEALCSNFQASQIGKIYPKSTVTLLSRHKQNSNENCLTTEHT